MLKYNEFQGKWKKIHIGSHYFGSKFTYRYSFKSIYGLLMYNIRMWSSIGGQYFLIFSYIRIGGGVVKFLFLLTGGRVGSKIGQIFFT